jgi:hypothetical protein
MGERAMHGIALDVLDVFGRVPRRGAETGGILLGARDGQRIVIDGYAPIPSEHRFGRLYQLSPSDRQNLRESLEAVNGKQGGLQAVGLYRSNARDEFACSEEDAGYQAAYFPEAERLLLLIQPTLSGPSEADFFFWRDGWMQQAFRRIEFPFQSMPDDAAAMGKTQVPVRKQGANRQAPEHKRNWLLSPPCSSPDKAAAYATLFNAPCPARAGRAAEDSSSSSGEWPGWAFAALLLLGAGFVGVRYDLPFGPAKPSEPLVSTSESETAPPETPSAAVPSQPAAALVPESAAAPEPAPVIQSRDREAKQPSNGEVRDLLNRWASAIRRGDIEQAANLYVPQARQRARDSVRRLLHYRRRMDLFDISNIAVTYPGPGQSVATFRRRWQSGGAPKLAGEQQVRLQLKRDGDQWQIASEDAQHLWTLRAQ